MDSKALLQAMQTEMKKMFAELIQAKTPGTTNPRNRVSYSLLDEAQLSNISAGGPHDVLGESRPKEAAQTLDIEAMDEDYGIKPSKEEALQQIAGDDLKVVGGEDGLMGLPSEDGLMGLPSYIWSPSLLEALGLPRHTKDGKPCGLGDEYPMGKQRRVMMLKDIPDIRDFRDLSPKDKLPQDSEDTKNLTEGEKFWMVQAAPTMHRQLLQILSVSAFLAQETAGHGRLIDGTQLNLRLEDIADLCSSLVALTVDSIRSIVDFQRSRLLLAGGRKPPPSVVEIQRQIISERMEDSLAKKSERIYI